MTTRARRALSGGVIAALIAAGLVLVPTAAQARTLTVTTPGGGGQYTSIQAAIDAAANGDTITVAAGTYNETLGLSKYITLKGAGAGATILSAVTPGRAAITVQGVPFNTGGLRAEVSGFTIRGGNGAPGHAGGILMWLDADALIDNNTIENNSSQAYGAGISIIRDSDPVILNNTIRNNTAHSGGGIFVALRSNPTIYGNTFTNNKASGVTITNGGAAGGAIYLEATPGQPSVLTNPIVMNNTIENNQADFAGGGIMLRTGVTAIIENNRINNNTAAYGGGVHIETAGSAVQLRANTISNNTAPASLNYGGSGYGGGVSIYDNSKVSLYENVLTGNRASNGGGAVVVAESASLTLDSNSMIGNGVGPAAPGNPSPTTGGAVYVANAKLTAYNNVFARNDAALGGAIGASDNGAVSVMSNTITDNTSSQAPGGAVFVQSTAARGDVSNNIFSGNANYALFEQNGLRVVKRNNMFASTSNAYFGYANGDRDPASIGGDIWGDGNFAGDPLFINAGGDDYSLQSTSAAIDRAALSDVPVIPAGDRRNALRTGPVDVGAFEYQATPLITSHVYRFWSTSKKSHFYTITPAERDQVASQYSPVEWRYEGVAYDAFQTAQPDTIPLYRFYSQTFQGHFYTASQAERDQVEADFPDDIWLYEGVAYYVYPETYAGGTLVYRFWSPDNRHHFYTASTAEKDYVAGSFPSNVWTYEGPRFRVPR